MGQIGAVGKDMRYAMHRMNRLISLVSYVCRSLGGGEECGRLSVRTGSKL